MELKQLAAFIAWLFAIIMVFGGAATANLLLLAAGLFIGLVALALL